MIFRPPRAVLRIALSVVMFLLLGGAFLWLRTGGGDGFSSSLSASLLSVRRDRPPSAPAGGDAADRRAARGRIAPKGEGDSLLDVAGEDKAQYAPDEIIVKFRANLTARRSSRTPDDGLQAKEHADPQSVFREARLPVGDIERVHPIRGAVSADAAKTMSDLEKGLYRTYKVTLPKGTSIQDALEELAGNPNIEYAEPNYIFRTLMVPDDPYYQSSGSWNQSYDDLWGIKKINADRVWDITQGEGVVVAVIDTGVDENHEDLRDNIWLNEDEIPGNGIDDDGNGYADDVRGWDFAYGDNDPSDIFGHGSHVAGTIAAAGNNALGVIGVAPKAKIMIVKGLFDDGSGVASSLAAAVRYAADNGARITNNSWGGTTASQTLTDAFNYAQSADVLSIAAAGDTGGNGVLYPARYDSVVAVSATDPDDTLASFSSYGDAVEIAAPGGGKKGEAGVQDSVRNILSTMPDDSLLARASPRLNVAPGYWRLSGTSMAAPHAAGVAALIRSAYPQSIVEQVRGKLRDAANGLGEPGNPFFGYGRADAYFAVRNYALAVTSPGENSFVNGIVNVAGSASMESGFQKYELSVAPKTEPGNATLVASSAAPVQDGVLGVWDTARFGDRGYRLFLKLYGGDGVFLQRTADVVTDNTNQPPAFIGLEERRRAIPDSLLRFVVEARDPDDAFSPWGQLKYSAFNLPAGAEFDPETRVFSWTPDESQKGKNYDVTFRVEDSENRVEQTVTISVLVLVGKRIASMTTPNATYRADIHEDNIVWRAVNSRGTCSLYRYEISADAITELADAGAVCSTASLKDVAVYGNRIAYAVGAGIWLYDLSGETMKISSSAEASSPDIDGDTVVWMARSGPSAPFAVYRYDVPTGMETPIGQLPNQTYQEYPLIDGNLVVYKGSTGGDENTFLYNIATGEHRALLRDTGDRRVLAHYRQLHQNKLVFEGGLLVRGPACNGDPNRPPAGTHDERETFFDLYFHDIPSGRETRITPDAPILENGVGFYGDTVAWTDRRDMAVTEWRYEPVFGCWLISGSDGNTDVYVSDVSGAGGEIRITSSPLPEESPILYKNRLVYFARHDSDDKTRGSLFLYELFFVPRIISIAPTTVREGDFITITGRNFGYDDDGGNSFVQFAPGVQGAVRSWSDIEIVVEVPPNAVSGEVKVITKGGESNGIWLEIIGNQPPLVSDIPDQTVPEGQSFTIIPLDDYVADPDDGDADIVWEVTGNSDLTVVIDSNRTVTISPPDPEWNGAETLVFTATDPRDLSDSDAAIFTVAPVNDPPVASDQSVTTAEDTPIAFTLTASDVENDPLNFLIVTGPSNGTLSGGAPDVTYTPAANFNGRDSFTFKANDGAADSAAATVSITVTPVNDPPVADNQSVTTEKDTPKSITLTASDPDGDALAYSIVTQPVNGALAGSAPNVTYTPLSGFIGDDGFRFKVNDGQEDSNVATVSIAVKPVLCLSTTLQSRTRRGMTHELSAASLTVTDSATGTPVKETSLPLDTEGKLSLTDTSGIDGSKHYDLTLKPRGHLALTHERHPPFAFCHSMGEAKHGDYNETGRIDLSDLITAINYHVQRENSPHREKFEDIYRNVFGLAEIVEVIRNYVETR